MSDADTLKNIAAPQRQFHLVATDLDPILTNAKENPGPYGKRTKKAIGGTTATELYDSIHYNNFPAIIETKIPEGVGPMTIKCVKPIQWEQKPFRETT